MFFSINTKLFLCFWIITIVSIFTTRFISEQFNNDEVTLKLNHEEVRKLEHISRQIQRFQPENLQLFIRNSPRRIGKSLLIEEIGSEKLFTHNNEKFAPFIDYINRTKLQKLSSIRLPFGHITGPKTFSLHNKQYRLFVIDRIQRPNFGNLIMQIPPLLRFLIPLSISFIFCWFLARSLSKPIYRMQNAAIQLGEGDLSIRVDADATRNDELGSLANSFNSMAEKLESSLGAQQRLIADVSHELRSPMTRLQMALALAQKRAESPIELNKHLVRCETEVARLDQMIANVLSLSRLENSLYAVSLEQTELNSLISLIVQDAQYIADDKEITIVTSNIPSLIISADANLLSSAINNVLLNAIKYSPVKSSIALNIEQTSDNIIITIVDQGPGVAEKNIAQLFEPFYRVADARDRKTGGTGLGLAIAKQAVLAHKGAISAVNNAIGLTVVIEIPRNI